LGALFAAMVVVATASIAFAGSEALPSAIDLKVGKNATSNEVAAVASDDGSYYSVDSVHEDGTRSVVYVGTFDITGGVTTSMAAQFLGTASEPCVLRAFGKKWSTGEWIRWGTHVTVESSGGDQSSSFAAPGDRSRFIKEDGTLKVKLKCVGDSSFTLNTERFRVAYF
jgi:hypothetical protein